MADRLEAPGASAPFRIAVYALIFDQNEQILLAHRRDIDWWNLPGGGMEAGETVEEAMQREVWEETGLEVTVKQLIGVYSKPLKQEVVLTFRCLPTGGQLTETEESRECRYFDPQQLPQNLLPKHRQRLEDALLKQPEAIIRTQRTTTAEDQKLASN